MTFKKQITKNKIFEIDIGRLLEVDSWFDFELSIFHKSSGDYPGFYFHIIIAKLWFECNFYDTRDKEEDNQIDVDSEDK